MDTLYTPPLPTTVPGGGTGLATLTTGAILTGAGASNVALVGPGSTGQLPVSTGSVVAMCSVSGDATLASGGALTVANGVITPAKLSTANSGPLNACRNLILNGGVKIWQRGTLVVPTDGTYGPDGWQYIRKVSSCVHNLQQSTDPQNISGPNHYTNFAVQAVVSTGDSSISSTEVVSLRTHIEGYDANEIWNTTFTLSFWVAAITNGIYCVRVCNSAKTASYVKEYTINASNTWEYKTITFNTSLLTGSATGTFLHTNGVGLQIDFCMAGGSNFQTTADAWQAGDFYCTSNQVNGVQTGGAFELARVQLEAGSAATPYANLTYQDELFRCYRRCRVYGSGTSPEYLFAGQHVSTTVSKIPLYFQVPMRAAPAFTISTNVANFGVHNSAGTIINDISVGLVASSITAQSALLTHSVASGLIAGQGTILVAQTGTILASADYP